MMITMDPLSALCRKENDKRCVIDNESQESKSRCIIAIVAYRWAGAIMKVNRAYILERWGQNFLTNSETVE